MNQPFLVKNERKRVAIIGSGVAGMGTAYFLSLHPDKCQVDLLERENYLGGHTHTHSIQEDGLTLPIDTGFIVLNNHTYPNLTKLFDLLGVSTRNSDMSFTVRHSPSGLEFAGTGMDGLFVQRKNILSPRYWLMLYHINKFNTQAPDDIKSEDYSRMTLGEYVKAKNLGQDFLQKFLIPMASAVWSTPVDKMLSFPIKTLVEFFSNHGFLGLNTQLQWKTVVGGSQAYRPHFLKHYSKDGTNGFATKCDSEVVRVDRETGGVKVTFKNGEHKLYDLAILATHGDEALQLLGNPTELERGYLGKFKYQENQVILHTDPTVMPNCRKSWSSWNCRLESSADGRERVTTVYWMNRLQGLGELGAKKDYFVSLNEPGTKFVQGQGHLKSIDASKIIKKITYHHPLFDSDTQRIRENLGALNKRGPVFFCGSYFKYGFHEDAFTSSVQLAQTLLGEDFRWN